MATLGYARVSTDGQSLTAQLAELESREMRQDISGEGQWRSSRPQAVGAGDGNARQRGRVGRHPA
jgi:DNA invertase Pin-like site-specific DNA recombinase